MWDVHSMIQLDVDQFYGIEIEEFPSQIAQVAMWLMDHQMNMMVSAEFGMYFARIPLKSTANIICGNALRIDWNDVIPAERLSYIMGNPPFVGKQYQSDEQKADLSVVFKDIKGAGVLDFVVAWHFIASKIMQKTNIRCAFVSTNSITQGEQVGVLWPLLNHWGVKIFFAHRTFKWQNEARGKAAVHCVIIGFSINNISNKTLFDYENIDGEAHAIAANEINPYLVDAPFIALSKRRTPVSICPKIAFGSMPNDGGFLIMSEEEAEGLITTHPSSSKYVRRFGGSEDFINNRWRFCLWLVDADPSEIRSIPPIAKRIAKVAETRLNSSRPTTIALASTPSIFGEIRQPETDYFVIPEVSSENRYYVPVGRLPKETIASNKLYTISTDSLFVFGIVQSSMHMSWMRTVCGRLKSDYQYSAGIVYNNFPWPENPSDKQKQAIEAAAQAVLDARAQFPEASLADLYDPLTMPPVLLKAHQTLDKAVDTAYGRTNFKTEAERVAFLFELYQKYTSVLGVEKPKKKGKKKEG